MDNIDPQTPLLTGRVLDSLGLLNLMTHTEMLLGREMSEEELEMKHFQTVQIIVEGFFGVASVRAGS